MKAARHISTFLLALWMILSSTGLALAAHLCNGELRELSLFQQQQSCCPAESTAAHCGDREHEAADCCENICLLSGHETTSPKTLRKQSLQTDQFVPAFTAASLLALLLPETEAANTNYNQYPPPLTVRDIPVLVQSFLL